MLRQLLRLRPNNLRYCPECHENYKDENETNCEGINIIELCDICSITTDYDQTHIIYFETDNIISKFIKLYKHINFEIEDEEFIYLEPPMF